MLEKSKAVLSGLEAVRRGATSLPEPTSGESHVRDLQQFICNNYTRECEGALFRRADGLHSLWNPGCRCHDDAQSTVFGERCALFRSPTWSGCVILACPFHRTSRALSALMYFINPALQQRKGRAERVLTARCC